MPRSTLTVEQRFWAKVKRTDLCWLWTGALTYGYGSFWNGDRQQRAHRYAYELLVGPIPEGLQIDHLCRNRRCVNPDHLEAVTNQINVLRGVSSAAYHARQTHCYRGHPLAGENLHFNPNGSRVCRECARINNRKSWAGNCGVRLTDSEVAAVHEALTLGLMDAHEPPWVASGPAFKSARAKFVRRLADREPE